MNILKSIIALLIINVCFSVVATAQISINSDGSTPDASAMLDVSSTNKVILIPRMDSTSRNSITNPAIGLMVYDSTTTTFWYYDNSQWNEIRNGSESLSSSDLVDNYSTNFNCINTASSLEIGGTPVQVIVVGNYAYVIDEDTDDLKIIDISIPTSPSVSGTVAAGGEPVAMAISGDYAYIVDNDAEELKIIDISDVSNPSETGSYNFGAEPLNIVINGNYAYILERGTGTNLQSLEIIDISDASNPSWAANSSTAGSRPIDMKISGNYAFVIEESLSEIKVLDISNPTNPGLVHYFSLGTAQTTDIEISGNYAYVSTSGDMEVVDISNPLSLSNAGSVALGIYSLKISVSGDYAYIIDNLYDELEVVDISNPTNPLYIENYDIGSNPTSIMISGDYAYIVDKGSNDLKVIGIDACELYIGINPDNGELTTVVEEVANQNEVVDNLGNHQATTNIQLLGEWLTNDGDDEGMTIDDDGNVSLSSNLTVSDTLSVIGTTIFEEEVYVSKSSGGSNNFLFTIENLNNKNNSYNNGINIVAGQSSTEYNSSKQGDFIRFRTPDGTKIGSIYQDAAGSVALNTTSDIRLKTNIQTSQYGLANILDIKVRDYHYKSDASQTPQTGFLAQQLNEVYPVAVKIGGEDAKTNPWTVDYSKLTPLLVKGMQEQQEVIEQLTIDNGQLSMEVSDLKMDYKNQQTEIEALKAKNQQLETEVAKIDNQQSENQQLKQRVEQLEEQVTKINQLEAMILENKNRTTSDK